MITTTKTTVFDTLEGSELDIDLTVEHDRNDAVCFKLTIGDEFQRWFDMEDLLAIRAIISKAIGVRRDAIS